MPGICELLEGARICAADSGRGFLRIEEVSKDSNFALVLVSRAPEANAAVPGIPWIWEGWRWVDFWALAWPRADISEAVG